MSDTVWQGGGSDLYFDTGDNWSDGAPTAGNGKRAVFPSSVEARGYSWSGMAPTLAAILVQELTMAPDLGGAAFSGEARLDGGALKNPGACGSIVGNGLLYGASGNQSIKAEGGVLSFDNCSGLSSGLTFTIGAGATLNLGSGFVDHYAVPDSNIGPDAAAAQLVTDKAAVDAGKADILNTRTILTITGTLAPSSGGGVPAIIEV